MRRTDEAMLPSDHAGAGVGTARLNEHGELEPIAVDESLTTLLFAPRSASSREPTSAPTPAASPLAASAAPEPVTEPRRAPARPAAALFEMV